MKDRQEGALSMISRVRDRGFRFLERGMTESGLQGLAPSHGNILFCLKRYGRLTMKQLARLLGRDKSTLTVLVEKLVSGGYVLRHRDDKDGRVIWLSLTARTRAVEGALSSISSRLNAVMFRGVTSQEKEQLIGILRKLDRNLGEAGET